MHLDIRHFLSSIEIHLLKVTYKIFSKYKRSNCTKKRESGFYFFRFPSGLKTSPIDPVFPSWVHVIKKRQSKINNKFKELKGRQFFSLKFES